MFSFRMLTAIRRLQSNDLTVCYSTCTKMHHHHFSFRQKRNEFTSFVIVLGVVNNGTNVMLTNFFLYDLRFNTNANIVLLYKLFTNLENMQMSSIEYVCLPLECSVSYLVPLPGVYK